ncbi:DUF6894 family protein [uncultured Methylobacterium sp.]|uniref:DUF6894 family protein n=1 Tax=uncultured Methylobacterium sp. TaxID=157278 RepID=UPI0035CB1784
MIRAFFNIRLDDAYLPERTGQCVRDVAEARAVARTIIRRLVVQHGGEPRLLDAVMTVTDADGTRLLDLSFFEALYVPVAPPERAGTDLRRAAIRAPRRAVAELGAASARLRARIGPVGPRLRAALAQAHGRLSATIGRLPQRRHPRRRRGLDLEPGR